MFCIFESSIDLWYAEFWWLVALLYAKFAEPCTTSATLSLYFCMPIIYSQVACFYDVHTLVIYNEFPRSILTSTRGVDPVENYAIAAPFEPLL